MPKSNLHFAVVVGINSYPELRPLNSARGDALEFAAWLLDPAGGGLPGKGHADALLPEGHVITITVADGVVTNLTRREDATPVRTQVMRAIHDVRKAVEQRVDESPQDWAATRFYFYGAGHGIAPDARDAALLMADAGRDSYDENVSCAEILKFMGVRQPFREVVVFADCCREHLLDGAPIGKVSGTLPPTTKGQVVSVFGCATHFGELAYEPPATEATDAQRGYFTKALLEGLRGQAAKPGSNGEVNSNSLSEYVSQRVIELTRSRPKQQVPKMEADPAFPIVFRSGQIAPPAIAPVLHEVTIVIGIHTAITIELRNSRNESLGRHQTAAGDVTVHLEDGLYEVVAVPNPVNFRNDGLFRVIGGSANVVL